MQGTKLLAIVMCAGATFVAAPAVAAPATANTLQLGLGFRYGFELNSGDFNPWGSGIGADVGFTLPNAVYIGGKFDYFFGDTQNVGGVETSGNIWQLTPEVGYDVGIGPVFVIRPKVGAGLASVHGKVCRDPGGCTSNSASDFVLAPGAAFIVMTKSFSLSLDFRYDVIFADKQTLKALIFSVGVGF